MRNLAKLLDAQLRIIGIQGSEWNVPEELGMSPGPIGFLHAFRDADYIVTNSFHGTVFSLVFQKRFLTMRQEGENAESQNIRAEELLGRIGLDERLHDLYSSQEMAANLEISCDWIHTAQAIESWRRDSVDWLVQQLQAVG